MSEYDPDAERNLFVVSTSGDTGCKIVGAKTVVVLTYASTAPTFA